MFPGILGAALLSFSLSFDDFIITNLNAGTTTTFPMYVWGVAQRGVPMQVNVVGTLMFVVVDRDRAQRRAEPPAPGQGACLDVRPSVTAERALADAEPSVFWLDDPARPAALPSLTGRTTADLVVVGGGYTGLWTALRADRARPGLVGGAARGRPVRRPGQRTQRRLRRRPA